MVNIVQSQNFGCFDESAINDAMNNNIFSRQHTFDNSDKTINWEQFSISTHPRNGYFESYSIKDENCNQYIKMQGSIKDNLQEGIWKLYINEKVYITGNYVKGKKEGLWIRNFINNSGKSTSTAEIQFYNDLFNGPTKYYFKDGKLAKSIDYKNGLYEGLEIEYNYNYDNDDTYLHSIKEYSNGLLNGNYLIYDYKSLDTLESGHYSKGKKNGRFLFNNDGLKHIIDYSNGKIDGKFIKYHRNGIIALELDYKNNLPYNFIQANDSIGSTILIGTFLNGNGTINLYYESGSLNSIAEYKNQLIAGKYKNYYPSGNIREEGILFTKNNNFKFNKQIQTCQDLNMFSAWSLNFTKGTNYTYFNENGTVKAIIYSQESDSTEKDFIITEHYENEKLKKEECRLNGLKIGRTTDYHSNGRIEMTGNFKSLKIDSNETSVKDGIFKYYYPNDTLRAEITYSDGIEIGNSYFFNDSGILKRIKIIEPSGNTFNIFENDTVNLLDTKGKKQGKWISLTNQFAENNCSVIPNEIEYYENDKPTGVWESFYFSGRKIHETIIWQDSVHAHMKQWYSNGKLNAEGSLVNRMRNGEWKEYDYKKGFLRFKGDYNCDNKVGIWQIFNRKGKLIKEIDYKND